MEFERKIFPGFMTADILNEIQKNDVRITVRSSGLQRQDHLHVNVSTILHGKQKEMKNYVKKSKRVEEYARRFPRGHWSFLGPGSEKKWYATYNSKPNGCWDRTAETMMQFFRKIWSPSVPLYQCLGERRIKKHSRRKDNNTFHSK